MALHRDIYWVGKQWAVTGHGVQACNQKQKGQFYIEASRLWEDGVQDAVRGLSWVNLEDFDKAITAARKYYPEPPRKAPPPVPPVLPPIHMAPAPEPQASRLATPKFDMPKFDMRFEGVPAKLRPVWRIRIRGDGRPSQ
ncbi:MAG: hypothetical protein ABSG88_09635 [Bradyrhizobium sp.]